MRSRILATPRSEILISCHVGSEEDNVGREIPVNYGRSLAVEVAQTTSHIMKDGVVDLLWENVILLYAGSEDRNSMTRMCAGTFSRKWTPIKKLDNVWMAYLTE